MAFRFSADVSASNLNDSGGRRGAWEGGVERWRMGREEGVGEVGGEGRGEKE